MLNIHQFFTFQAISKMELPTRALKKGSKVLIVDDFMKGGGTLTGMEELVKEFEGTIAGVCVLCEADFDNEKLINNYLSLVKISEIDTTQKIISAEPGNFLDETDFDRF